MKRVLLMLALFLTTPVLGPAAGEDMVNYFPNVMYGHVLAGTAASWYETTLIIRSEKTARVHIDVFDELSEPMEATFADREGNVAATTTSFGFVLQPDRSIEVKLQLPPHEVPRDVAVRTGWVTVTSSEELEASALILITAAGGKTLRQVVAAQTPTRS